MTSPLPRWLTSWPLPLQFLVVLVAGWVNRQQQDVILFLSEEVRVLEEQRDEALGGRAPRFTDDQRRRLAVKAKAVGRRVLDALGTVLVTPDTLLRWYRELVAAKYDGSAVRGPGRPRVGARVVALVLRIAAEYPSAGYQRIAFICERTERKVAPNTVKRILVEHGIDPAPKRGAKTTWHQFVRAHLDVMAGADFFAVEVLTLRGLVRYWVFFVIHYATRKVHVAGITSDPHAAWMRNVARGLTDPVDGFLRGIRYLVLDRDPLYRECFRAMVEGAGIELVRLPAYSPNLNPLAERWVRSIRQEALRRIVPLGEEHLRRVVRNYVLHYNRERPHRALGGRLIEPDETAGRRSGRIACRERLGGLLRYYYRTAA